MSEWLVQWWPVLASILLLIAGLSWLVLRLVRYSPSRSRSAFETVFQKGMVQPIITHIMAWTFALMAGSMIIFFLAVQEYDRAEDTFSYVVAVIGPIVGFWFGSRGREGKGVTGQTGNDGPPEQAGPPSSAPSGTRG